MEEEEIKKRLRELETLFHRQGQPVTLQRRIILETVLRRDDHPTVEQVFQAVRDQVPAVSRTTVYRGLETLVAMRLVQQLSHPRRTVRFDGRTDRHHHAVCVYCNRVIDVEDARFDRLPLPEDDLQGFRIDDYSVLFVGTCPKCREERPDSGPGRAKKPGGGSK